jgi:hypothetical protein
MIRMFHECAKTWKMLFVEGEEWRKRREGVIYSGWDAGSRGPEKKNGGGRIHSRLPSARRERKEV